MSVRGGSASDLITGCSQVVGPRLHSSDGLMGAEDLLPRVSLAISAGVWEPSVLPGGPPCRLFECPRDKAAGFPQSK